MASESTQAQSTFNSSGQQYRSVRKRGGPMSPTSVAKRFTPHHRPSSSSKLRDYGPCPLAMASSNVSPPHDSLQVVNDVIEASQIEKAVKSLEDDSAAEGIYTEFKWTGACEDLLRTYRERIHPRIITRSEVATFVKPYTETQRTFKTVVRINPSVQKAPERGIGLPTDYHIIIPLVPQGLPTWVENRATKTRQKVPWKKGSVVCIGGGTSLICTKDGGGIYMMIGGETKKHP